MAMAQSGCWFILQIRTRFAFQNSHKKAYGLNWSGQGIILGRQSIAGGVNEHIWQN
jgi:hypothetical protein